jgi:REP element-mobilizing transposase RayT
MPGMAAACFAIRADPRIGPIVEDTLLHFDAERYRLMEWVIMPNHVHLLAEFTSRARVLPFPKKSSGRIRSQPTVGPSVTKASPAKARNLSSWFPPHHAARCSTIPSSREEAHHMNRAGYARSIKRSRRRTRNMRVSSSLSKIPYGGFSPVRLQTGSMGIPPSTFTLRHGLKRETRIPPSPDGLYEASVPISEES